MSIFGTVKVKVKVKVKCNISIFFSRSRESKTKKIFVGGVSQETATEEVREYFRQFGENSKPLPVKHCLFCTTSMHAL